MNETQKFARKWRPFNDCCNCECPNCGNDIEALALLKDLVLEGEKVRCVDESCGTRGAIRVEESGEAWVSWEAECKETKESKPDSDDVQVVELLVGLLSDAVGWLYGDASLKFEKWDDSREESIMAFIHECEQAIEKYDQHVITSEQNNVGNM